MSASIASTARRARADPCRALLPVMTPSMIGGQRNDPCRTCFQTSPRSLLSQTNIFRQSLRLAR